MNLEVSIPLDDALDLSWQTLAECFEPQELLMRQALVDKYYPKRNVSATAEAADGESAPSPDGAGSEPAQKQT